MAKRILCATVGLARKGLSLAERSALAALILPLRWIAGALYLTSLAEGFLFTLALEALALAALWGSALLLAVAVGYLTAEASAYSQTSPSVSRALLGRTRSAELPAAATKALERAAAAGNPESVRTVYENGLVDGAFHLRGYQETTRQRGGCRRAPPAPPEGFRLILDEKIDLQTLVREASCADLPGSLPLGLFLDAYKGQAGAAPDLHAVLESDNPRLLSFALASGAEREAEDWQGRTALLALLDRLADTEQRYYRLASLGDEKPAVEVKAKMKRYRQMVELLLAQGANVSAIDHVGRSVAFLALQSSFGPGTLALLLKDARLAGTTALGATLLHAAAASGRVEIARQLVDKGVPIRAGTVDGRTAMHFARGAEMVWYLLGMGLDADKPDTRGRTPFHYAVMRGDPSAARALGGLSSNRNARDYLGRAAFDYAPAPTKELKDAGGGKEKEAARPEWLRWRELAGELHLSMGAR